MQKVAKKPGETKALSLALFLIGLVMLIEAASTIFVLLEAPQIAAGSAGVAWLYILVKAVISLYALFIGFKIMKK
ncbi:MAG: hypothetical protein J4400_02395 [Candidatus Aenigmarchaeota archaeon]|nr:hypothetical protein [Candidatus Aenigmarchaeota archaeon]